MLTKEIKNNNNTKKTVFHDDVVPNLKPVVFFRWQQKSIKIPIPRDRSLGQ